MQDHLEGFTLGNPLSAQEDEWCITRLVDEKMRPMHVTIERKTCPHCPAVTHCPEHFQAAQIIESIAGINNGCAAWIRILS